MDQYRALLDRAYCTVHRVVVHSLYSVHSIQVMSLQCIKYTLCILYTVYTVYALKMVYSVCSVYSVYSIQYPLYVVRSPSAPIEIQEEFLLLPHTPNCNTVHCNIENNC